MHGLPLVLTLDIPEATPSNNVIKGMHFRVYQKLRRSWQMLVLGALQSGTERPAHAIERCHIAFERHSSGGGLDWDNAFGGLKPLLDCLVMPSSKNPDGLGLIVDDGPANIPVRFDFLQMKAKPGHGRTVVRIYDASGLPDDAPAGSWVC